MWAKKTEPRENERRWRSDTCRYTCPSLRTSPLVIVTANQILAPPSAPHPSAGRVRNVSIQRTIEVYETSPIVPRRHASMRSFGEPCFGLASTRSCVSIRILVVVARAGLRLVPPQHINGTELDSSSQTPLFRIRVLRTNRALTVLVSRQQIDT